MEAKHWTDQPDAVTQGETLCRIFMKNIGQSVEVRRIDYETSYFMTTGNLFGSQTIKVPDANTAFRILGTMSRLEDGQEIKLSKFPGVEIMENTANA